MRWFRIHGTGSRNHITRYGIDRVSNTAREVAKDMATEGFTTMTQQKNPVFEMPNSKVLIVRGLSQNKLEMAFFLGGYFRLRLFVLSSPSVWFWDLYFFSSGIATSEQCLCPSLKGAVSVGQNNFCLTETQLALFVWTENPHKFGLPCGVSCVPWTD